MFNKLSLFIWISLCPFEYLDHIDKLNSVTKRLGFVILFIPWLILWAILVIGSFCLLPVFAIIRLLIWIFKPDVDNSVN